MKHLDQLLKIILLICASIVGIFVGAFIGGIIGPIKILDKETNCKETKMGNNNLDKL